MTREQVEARTLDYHQSGFCCTEAIIKSVTESFTDERSNAIPKIGTGFCKGIGMTGEDICGTVVGGIIALGYLYGRMDRDEDKSQAATICADFRNMFLEKYKSTKCDELLKAFGEQEKMGKCKKMTADAAGMIADLISSTNND